MPTTDTTSHRLPPRRDDATPDPAPPNAAPVSRLPLIALSLGYFLVMLDVTVVTVAVPAIRGSLHAGPAGLQWIVDGYSTVFAGLLLLGGGLGDRLGHRTMFVAGLTAFTAASVGCGLAPTTGVLVVARLLQGAGAAFLVPASLALLQTAYPTKADRARAFGIWAGVSSIAFASGPVLGGLLVAGLDWRAVFWLNVPVALVAVLLTLRHVPSPPPRPTRTRMDPVGQVLGVVGLIALAGALNEAGTAGWTSLPVLAAFAAGALALTVFVTVERRLESGLASRPDGRAPLMPPSLFSRTGFAPTAVIGFLLSFGYYGMLFLATLYFQQERGYGALGTGLALLPSVCMSLIAAPLSGRITARTGPYPPMCFALLLGSVGFLGWLAADHDTAYPVLLFALIATGLATPMTVVAATAAIMESAPAGGAGVASAVFNVSRQVGNAVGVALFGTLCATAAHFTSGLHRSALIAGAAFLTGSALAAATMRRGAPPA
ncbi:MFS transporter [Kitasatospora sp. NBC_00374]|uniref:MFS transporter n=1 Tax=Kitasatospora sp. NBC_00374 TaxID=2975964 RepID=UPI0030E1DB37